MEKSDLLIFMRLVDIENIDIEATFFCCQVLSGGSHNSSHCEIYKPHAPTNTAIVPSFRTVAANKASAAGNRYKRSRKVETNAIIASTSYVFDYISFRVL